MYQQKILSFIRFSQPKLLPSHKKTVVSYWLYSRTVLESFFGSFVAPYCRTFHVISRLLLLFFYIYFSMFQEESADLFPSRLFDACVHAVRFQYVCHSCVRHRSFFLSNPGINSGDCILSNLNSVYGELVQSLVSALTSASANTALIRKQNLRPHYSTNFGWIWFIYRMIVNIGLSIIAPMA